MREYPDQIINTFIMLTDFENKTPILVDVCEINLIYVVRSKTLVSLRTGHAQYVIESVDEIDALIQGIYKRREGR